MSALRSTFILLFAFTSTTFFAQGVIQVEYSIKTIKDVQTGAERTSEYLPVIKGKSVAIVANQSSMIRKTHLVDSLQTLGINIKKVFCPEHGFRGNVDAGENVATEKDKKTGLT